MSFALLGLYSCKKSEDSGEKIREMTEVIPENDQAIQAYLKSHYCELDSDGNIVLGAVGSTGKTSIWDRADLKRKQQLYYQHYVLCDIARGQWTAGYSSRSLFCAL